MEEPSAEEAIAFEAKQIVKELSFGVESIEISTLLPSNKEVTYLNLLTKEKEAYCVELSTSGYRVVGKAFDINEISHNVSEYFESVYALMDRLSPVYRESFGNALAHKLEEVKRQQDATDCCEEGAASESD